MKLLIQFSLPFLVVLFCIGCASTPIPVSPEFRAHAQMREDFQTGLDAFHAGSYDEAEQIFTRLVQHNSGTSNIEDAHWMLAMSYEASGQFDRALKEYTKFRGMYAQSEHGYEALDRIYKLQDKLLDSREQAALKPGLLHEEYRIEIEDELEISVYGDKELVKTQTVRPDGRITFPLAGELYAVNSTPEELRKEITEGLLKYLKNPRVTVLVTRYTGKPIYLIGEVYKPGLIRVSQRGNVLEAVSKAEGMTDDADLRGALLIRQGTILPANFHKLFKEGDFSHNVNLVSGDAIFIPSVVNKKAFVLGEVAKPLSVTLKSDTTLMEAVAIAGGFTKDAIVTDILILRGGLANPKPLKVNVKEITKDPNTGANMLLQPHDVVYVPKTVLATVERYVGLLTQIGQTLFFSEFAIALYPQVRDVLMGKGTSQPVGVVQPAR